MDHVALDIMGPLIETESKNRDILLIQDYFTKWVAAAIHCIILEMLCGNFIRVPGKSRTRSKGFFRPTRAHLHPRTTG